MNNNVGNAADHQPSKSNLFLKIKLLFLKHEDLRGLTLLSPTFLLMLCAIALPIIILVTYSFWTQSYLTIDETFTLKNYQNFFEKGIYGSLLWKSIKVSALVTFTTICLAYPIAYFLTFRVGKNKMMWLILINLPFWTSYLLRVLGWKIMLGNNGVINSTLMNLGFIDQPLEYLLYSQFAVTLTLVHAWLAFAILPIYLSLSKIDRSLLEAASDLGENPIRTFLRVTLPLSMPGVIAAAVIQFIPVVGDYITPVMVGGPKGVMIGQIIAGQFGPANNIPMGAAITIMMMLSITAIVASFVWLARAGTVKKREMETTMGPAKPAHTRGGFFNPLTIYVMIFMVFLYIPSLMLPVFSFNDSVQMVLPLKDFTLKWYQQIPQDPALLTALGNSFRVALPVAFISSTLATIGALALTRYRIPGRAPIMGTILLPMVLPGIILAVGFLVVALALGVKLSLWTIGVAHVVATLPFSMLIVMARLEGLSKSLEEASSDLGENSFMTFWRVTFPLIMPAIAAAFLVSFTSSFDEFLFALFLGGNERTLPVYIFSVIRFPEALPKILALGACIFMGTAVLLGLAEWLRRIGVRQTEVND